MEKYCTQNEELILMLTEIYEQLEELEKALELNLSQYRSGLLNEQSEKLSICETQINRLEGSLTRAAVS